MSINGSFEHTNAHALDLTGVPYGPITPEAAQAFDTMYVGYDTQRPLGEQIITDLSPNCRKFMLPIEYRSSNRRDEAVGLAQAVVAELAGNAEAMERAGRFQGIHWIGLLPHAHNHCLATEIAGPFTTDRLSQVFVTDRWVDEEDPIQTSELPAPLMHFFRAIEAALPATPSESLGRRLFVVELPTSSNEANARYAILQALHDLRLPHKAIVILRFGDDTPFPYELEKLLPRQQPGHGIPSE